MEAEFIPAKKPRTAPEMGLAEGLSDRLTANQRIRTMITDQLTEGGTQLPGTEEELKMLLQNMREQDAVTLGEMKVKIDAANKSNDEIVKAALLELSRNGNHHPQQPVVQEGLRRVIAPTPELDDGVDIVPDQDLIGQQSLNYEEFKGRFGKA